MKLLDRTTNIVTLVCKIGVGLSFAVMIAVVLTQVIGRTIGASPVWTEEITRFALLYLAAFGVGLSFLSGDLVNVDVICENLPAPLPWLLRLLSAILTAGLALLLLAHSWKFTSIGRMQTSPAVAVRMDFIHFAITLLLALLLVFALLRIVNMLAGRDDGLPEKMKEG